MSDNFWQELTAIFRETLDNDSLTLTESTAAKDVEGWDSITHVLLVVAIERKFRIKLTAGEIQRLQNVGELAVLVRSKQAGMACK